MPRSRLNSSVTAVTMIIGISAVCGFCLIFSQTSKPVMSGSIRSSSMTSGGSCRACSRPVPPSNAGLAVKPYASRTRQVKELSASSSSTTRISVFFVIFHSAVYRSLRSTDMSIIGSNREVFLWKSADCCPLERAQPLLPSQSLCKAIHIYLEIAYPTGAYPQGVKSILEKLTDWPGDTFDCPPFVREGSEGNFRYYLRLGNRNYPHMKLYVETWPGGVRYFFRADTHDRHIVVPTTHPEYKPISDLCRINQEIASAIEDAWQAAGLPTFK